MAGPRRDTSADSAERYQAARRRAEHPQTVRKALREFRAVRDRLLAEAAARLKERFHG